ncbi:MAG: DUF2059 domain-containing protein [Erythrobacter sp.]
MIRRILIPAAGLAALALLPQQLAAQDMADETPAAEAAAEGAAEVASEGMGDPMADAMGMLGKMFPTEPLTAQQEARLPQAARIINRMIPEGTLGEMMGGMFDKLMNPMMAAFEAPASATVQKGIGVSPAAAGLTDEQTAEIATLLDPAYAERHAREMSVMPTMMREMMTLMEPTMRKAMSELYAINFTQKELDDIEAFFQTDSGTAYARKSFTMSSDPRVLSASMEAMPQMMGAFADFEKKIEAASADLPPKRSFEELSTADKAKIAELTGYSVEEIEGLLAESENFEIEEANSE